MPLDKICRTRKGDGLLMPLYGGFTEIDFDSISQELYDFYSEREFLFVSQLFKPGAKHYTFCVYEEELPEIKIKNIVINDADDGTEQIVNQEVCINQPVPKVLISIVILPEETTYEHYKNKDIPHQPFENTHQPVLLYFNTTWAAAKKKGVDAKRIETKERDLFLNYMKKKYVCLDEAVSRFFY